MQQLEFAQGTEAGDLRAFVRVDFAAGHQFHCEPYVPPGLAVQLLPR